MFRTYEGWKIDDPTTIYMMSICKFSSLAFSYEDGAKKEEEFKSEHHKEYRVIEQPSLLEVLSFGYCQTRLFMVEYGFGHRSTGVGAFGSKACLPARAAEDQRRISRGREENRDRFRFHNEFLPINSGISGSFSLRRMLFCRRVSASCLPISVSFKYSRVCG